MEEVYNDVSFRGEFTSYVKLRNALQAEESNGTPVPQSPSRHATRFVHYYDMMGTSIKGEPDPPHIAKCKRGMTLLYSSLFKGLSVRYGLASEEVRNLLIDVLNKYK